jgi:hypothetical protein
MKSRAPPGSSASAASLQSPPPDLAVHHHGLARGHMNNLFRVFAKIAVAQIVTRATTTARPKSLVACSGIFRFYQSLGQPERINQWLALEARWRATENADPAARRAYSRN